jgi:hypothetical protein
MLCEVFDRCLAVSRFLLDQAPAWEPQESQE